VDFIDDCVLVPERVGVESGVEVVGGHSFFYCPTE
jgi:hypothetical protein